MTGEAELYQAENAKDQSNKPAKEKFLESEVNLLILPFFVLSRQEIGNRTSVQYSNSLSRDGKKLEVSWKVTSNAEFGHPGPFDKKVHRAIEDIIMEKDLPISNPIAFSIYQLCKRMGMSTGGSQYRKIKEALKRIKFTGIQSKKAFFSKAQQEWIDDIFNLYDRIVFKGKKMPDGSIAEKNYLFLNSWYLDNLNALYIRPMNYDYYNNLKSQIAQRLYELLGVKFYYIIKNNLEYLRYRYSTLCQLLPIKRHYYESYIQRQLDSAHNELIKTSFLSQVERQFVEGEDENDWLIYYYPGQRAVEEVGDVDQKPQANSLKEGTLETQGIPGSVVIGHETGSDHHKEEQAKRDAELAGLVQKMIAVLDDEKSRPFYKIVARKCPTDLIYRCLGEVREAAELDTIRKTKGAVFTDKLKRYCHERDIDLGLKSGS